MLRLVQLARIFTATIVMVSVLSRGGHALAPTEQLLPATTKGFLSIPDLDGLLTAFDSIGVGRLLQEPSMEAFAESFRNQLNDRFGITGVRVGITWDDLRSICNKEVALALVMTDDAAQRHSIVALVDITGKKQEVAALLKQVDESMTTRQAAARSENWEGTPVTIYTVPVLQRGKRKFEAVVYTYGDTFVVTDHPQVARDILGRLQNTNPQPSLDKVRAFQGCMKRCAAEAGGLQPHVRWFVEPLGYSELARAAAGGRKRKRSDIIRALRNQGFDAVEGIGGFVNFDVAPYEVLNRAFIFAPPVPGADETRFQLAARMLHFHRVEDLAVERWVPANTDSYFSGTWDIQKSYEYLGMLVDEVVGDPGFWEDLKESLLLDENGPQISLDKDIIAHLGTRVTAITDHQLPVTPTSERFLVAISLQNPEALKQSLSKALSNDREAQRIPVGEDHEIWEVRSDAEAVPMLDIEGGNPEFDLGIEDLNAGAGNAEPFLSNAALAVVGSHFVVSSHKEFIIELIERVSGDSTLADDRDLIAVRKALVDLGGDDATAEAFMQTRDQLRVSYQLVKEGKMPESQSLIGKVLNEFLDPDEPNMKREQKIDGSDLPDFSTIEQYLGPVGAYLKAEGDGWFLAGVGIPSQAARQAINGAKIETALQPTGGTSN